MKNVVNLQIRSIYFANVTFFANRDKMEAIMVTGSMFTTNSYEL